MAKRSTDNPQFTNAYKNMRRLRYGLLGIRGRKLQALHKQYGDDFAKERAKAGRAPARYKHYVSRIREENRLRRIPREKYLKIMEFRRKQENAFEVTKRKEGVLRALQKHGALITAPIQFVPDPPQKEIHSETYFKERLDIFTSLERFIRGKLDEAGDVWLYGDGTLTPAEQYERKRIKLAIGAPGKPYENRERALAAIRLFMETIVDNSDRLEALFNRRKVQPSNAHAMKTTRLAKLIIGEMVRSPTSADHSELVYYSDDKAVHKLASLLLTGEFCHASLQETAKTL